MATTDVFAALVRGLAPFAFRNRRGGTGASPRSGSHTTVSRPRDGDGEHHRHLVL
ncbi:hypothetical protein ACFW9O_13635 [Streptomyces sp. NPDC059499]|uniref:hypothetical protein n=1 Tax=Streptomyces sp. NPDC059499 TaxID=3346852 RepID=UPI0036B6FCEA